MSVTMPEIFVNYRTGDQENAAVLVARELSRRFGREHVFFASRSLKLGEDFTQGLPAAVRESQVLLAVVGSRWLEPRVAGGPNPLSEKGDWVRREIVEARDNAVRVVPLLIGRTLPTLGRQPLPDDLRWLADCQYERFDSRTEESDLRRLGDRLHDLIPDVVDLDARAAENDQPRGGTTTVIHNPTGPVHSGIGTQNNYFGPGGDRR